MKVKVTARSYTLLPAKIQCCYGNNLKKKKIKLCKHVNHVSLSLLGAAVWNTWMPFYRLNLDNI